MRQPSGYGSSAVEAPEEVTSFVRTYTLTGGRTRPRHTLSLETVLEPGPGRPGPGLPHECEVILTMCRQRRCSLTELAGILRRPVSTVRILVSDLLDARALLVPAPSADFAYVPTSDPVLGARPSTALLEATLAALKTRFPDAVDAYAKAG
ncbi:DUF742 domain-containing protein [Streptomyces sp. NPDC051041]|uniref:DUF742 domain-containing protein n=1 Tax=Streptomyces sp. NPDC051041 TaxID=3365640 RepID=UPI00379EE5D5